MAPASPRSEAMKPVVVNTPVPIMLATTMAVAATSPILRRSWSAMPAESCPGGQGQRHWLGLSFALMRTLPVVVALGVLASAAPAHAFCGFYVGGAGAELYNNATLVVMMREGTRTVLSMQNNYQGPPSGFAMVVPVPVVLQEDNVKTLPREIFARVDKLSAPRLVEYWEQD